MLYKKLLILSFSGVAEWKNEKEMIIPNNMIGYNCFFSTCELFGDGKYILRGYYKGGELYRRTEYQNGRQHGLSLGWYENGQPAWKVEHQNDQQHGLSLGWWKDGQERWKEEYHGGKFIRDIL